MKLIEFPNILHWKPAKKIKSGVVLRQNLGEKSKETCNIILKQEAVVVKPPEWNFMAIIARDAKF